MQPFVAKINQKLQEIRGIYMTDLHIAESTYFDDTLPETNVVLVMVTTHNNAL